jgi:hypothetical protein
MNSPSVAVDGSDSAPRTAVGGGDAPDAAGANGVADGAGDDAAPAAVGAAVVEGSG